MPEFLFFKTSHESLSSLFTLYAELLMLCVAADARRNLDDSDFAVCEKTYATNPLLFKKILGKMESKEFLPVYIVKIKRSRPVLSVRKYKVFIPPSDSYDVLHVERVGEYIKMELVLWVVMTTTDLDDTVSTIPSSIWKILMDSKLMAQCASTVRKKTSPSVTVGVN